MRVQGVTPILNVSTLPQSFEWFSTLGWEKRWSWGDPPGFGAIGSGKTEIFLCQGGQGARGGPMPTTPDGDDHGSVWMTWWVDSPADVDAAHALALEHGMTVTWPPTDEEWNVREFHLRHPDGHVFRVSAALPETD
jgi:catechol 2,3-dioxygenase-like lactoylglutathione lyase family enzyme